MAGEARVLFMGPSSVGKTTHIRTLNATLRELRYLAGGMSHTLDLSSMLLDEDGCPMEGTELTLSITTWWFTEEVEGVRVRFYAIDYDGHSHTGTGILLNTVRGALSRERDAHGGLDVKRLMEAASIVADSVLEGSARSEDVLRAIETVAYAPVEGRSLIDVYLDKLNQALKGGGTGAAMLREVWGGFTSMLSSSRGRVNASTLSIYANLAAARAVARARGSILVVPLVSKTSCGGSKATLESVLERAVYGGMESILIGVPRESAAGFYIDFLSTRLAATAFILGMTLIGFHARPGTLAVLHPAHMPRYLSVYARKQALIDRAAGELNYELDEHQSRLVEKARELVKSHASGCERCEEAAREVAAAARGVFAKPRLAVGERALTNFPRNAAEVLGSVNKDVEDSLKLVIDKWARSGQGREADMLGGDLSDLLQAARMLREMGMDSAAAAIEGIIDNLYKGLMNEAVLAVYYMHSLLIRELLRLVTTAAEVGAAAAMKLAVVFSYLDVYGDPDAEEERMASIFNRLKTGYIYAASWLPYDDDIYTYPLLLGVEHDVVTRIPRAYKVVYAVPGGRRGEEGVGGPVNNALAYFFLCMEILPAVYGEKVYNIPVCRRIREHALLEGGGW